MQYAINIPISVDNTCLGIIIPSGVPVRDGFGSCWVIVISEVFLVCMSIGLFQHLPTLLRGSINLRDLERVQGSAYRGEEAGEEEEDGKGSSWGPEEALTKTSNTISNRNSDEGHPCVVPAHRGPLSLGLKSIGGAVFFSLAKAKIKARDLRGKKQLDDLKVELSQLLVTKVTGRAAFKLSKIRVVRKSIARILTVINQTHKENLRKFYKDKKYKPLDLRPKKTQAMRHRLNKHQENTKTKKQQRKEWLYSLWKYAVKS
ncbi:PREDICTED: uncharacterized protein LOC102824457 [Chrysochloris asiatica]|uniref:Large ribosomal subunit protein uL29 n=1 Tax=Chrysochloris asiatica TaxID=185453 RepID=A0A9B0UF38_CHRAS|nr:PREDICTED: uncharacterized protein LOC102824457 [Chrysochloris asiatica]